MRTCPPRYGRAPCSSSTFLCPSSKPLRPEAPKGHTEGTCGNEGKEKAQQPLGIAELLSVEAAGGEKKKPSNPWGLRGFGVGGRGEPNPPLGASGESTPARTCCSAGEGRWGRRCWTRQGEATSPRRWRREVERRIA